MSTTITETGPFERLVRFQVSEDQIREAKAATARKLSRDLRLKGFRPGKAPLPVVEAAVGSERLRSETIDDLLPPLLGEILSEEELRPAVHPALESLSEVDGGVEVEVRVTLWPEIELPTWRDRQIEVASPEVTEAELDSQIERMLEQFATVEEVDRPAQPGDFVSVDIQASQDGEPVEEATASDLLYEVGSGLFIEGIDQRLEGAVAGAEVSFDGALPDGFGERAGETVTFEVTVNEVKERVLPELTDEWVEENTEFDSVDELRAELRRRLTEAKREAVYRQFSERALSTLVDQVEVDLPEALVRAEIDSLLHRFLHRLEEAELSLEDYFSATGLDQQGLIDDLRRQADQSIRNRLVLEAVAEDAGIAVTPEGVAAVVRALAARSDDPEGYLEAFRRSGRELALAGDILRNKALEAIVSAAIPVDEEGHRIEIDLHPESTEVEAEIVEPDAVEGEIVVAQIVEEEE